ELASIRETKDRTLHLIRSLIKDLHRSPLGRAGLAEALESFCADIGNDARLRFVTDITNVEMPAPVQLLCFQVARESIMNIVKHAGATTVSVSLRPTDEGARLIITDDGEGFDVEAGSPEGHFGLAMMRERAQVTGGDLTLESTPGEGSTVTAEFKTNWLVESSSDGSEQAPA
ncbi:MAG TPA: ATP-binding protein, partial [Actinomycetota bacterium]